MTELTMTLTEGGPVNGYFAFTETPPVGTIEGTLLELGLTGYQRIHRLMTVMEQPTPNKPEWPPEDVFRLRIKLDFEEQMEKLFNGYYFGDIVQLIDGAADVEVVNTGSMVAFGIDHDLVMAEVDRSNLSKLDENGKPIKNEFGKFLKGPNYSPPDLAQFTLGLVDTPPPYDTKRLVLEELELSVKKALDTAEKSGQQDHLYGLFHAMYSAAQSWFVGRQSDDNSAVSNNENR